MLVELLLAMALAGLASAALCPVVIAAGLWDNPDSARKNHHAPTPTAGGLAAASGFALALAVLSFWPHTQWTETLAHGASLKIALAVAAAFAALMLGLFDDLHNLGPRFKFGLMTALSLFVAIFIARAQVFSIGGGVVLDTGIIFGVLGSALWVFTMANAVNFIDGANGLSMGSMAVGLVGLAVIAVVHGAPHAAALALCGVGGLVGLLCWNFPKGKVFAGDAGALFSGVLAAAAGLILVQDGGVSPIIPPLLFFPILADVLLTLAYRVRKGRPLLEAHREHLYQVGLRAGLSHTRIAVIYWIATAHCAAIAFVASYAVRIAPSSLLEPQPGDVPIATVVLGQAAGWFASLAPYIALAVLAIVAMRVSDRVRRFAEARSLV
jgi:UDP-N-acetylmuramyl pentapeptide phosphotransferase/UDP-N-acetylglucosamine-1-phosphate transferase